MKFEDVSWSDDEDILADKLNKMATNEKYLMEQTVPHRYQAYGIDVTDGVKVCGGVAVLGPGPGRQLDKDVYFGKFFTPGCRPVVTATLATAAMFRVFITIRGPNGYATGSNRPDHNGFNVVLDADPHDIPKLESYLTNFFPVQQRVHWIALGY